ncbi:MAG TPA: gluconate 2-dehydrogenase subunit 3 family protein [Gemmatimonadaceae bacterium]|nr:gluconate 2-dehydrogenase subunit 3 family protein [Gemmatimonadaceae bacterium]
MSELVLPPVRAAFRAIATTVVPEAAALDENGWAEAEALVERTLAARPAAIRRQLQMLIRAIDLLPLLRYGRRFTALDAARRTRVLLAFQDSPLLLLRRGLWGIRTLVMLGYYARPAARAAVGYRADPRGWEARR